MGTRPQSVKSSSKESNAVISDTLLKKPTESGNKVKRVDLSLFQGCEIFGCKRVKRISDGTCHCLDEIHEEASRFRVVPKLDKKVIATGLNKVLAKAVYKG